MVQGDQTVFETCYRGRQSALHHLSYMRMAKVLMVLQVLEEAGVSLEGKTVFDYGFGAGTLFRYCPRNAQLFGVELDSANVAGVREMLKYRGHSQVDLDTITAERWTQHRLLHRRYDVFVCSHVLEHLADPVALLRQACRCLERDGVFLGLVPVNERAENPHHVQRVDKGVICRWAEQAELAIAYYTEGDPWTYWLQPLYAHDAGWQHTLAQVSSMVLGIPATLLGHRLWSSLGLLFAQVTRSKPTQAAFVLTLPESNGQIPGSS